MGIDEFIECLYLRLPPGTPASHGVTALNIRSEYKHRAAGIVSREEVESRLRDNGFTPRPDQFGWERWNLQLKAKRPEYTVGMWYAYEVLELPWSGNIGRGNGARGAIPGWPQYRWPTARQLYPAYVRYCVCNSLYAGTPTAFRKQLRVILGSKILRRGAWMRYPVRLRDPRAMEAALAAPQ